MSSIICADDDPDMQAMYSHILKKRNYEVRFCASGEEVITAFEERPADLVILDMNMPGMTGLNTTEALRKGLDSFQVPIIIVSANDSEATIVQGLSMGADEYIVKPFKASELLAKIAVALQKRGSANVQDMGLSLGSKFAGRYEIQRKIGAGGFSTVYYSHDTHTAPPKETALKVYDLPPSKRNDRQFLSNFLREAYEHSKLTHPNIIKLFDFGQTGGYYFLAMEYVPGQTLDEVVRLQGALGETHVALIGYEVAKALRYMDENRIIHRDIKPANIMITANGDVKVLDFGLAKKQEEGTLSIKDEFRGTPQFVSPEYILGDANLDIRTDIYSLGATLYFAATNVRPFSGNATIEILNNHFREIPPAIKLVNQEYSETFSDLVDRMLARDRNQRPTLDEILHTLRIHLS
jgi:DNA-binding response OmpR family regulator